MEARVDSGAPNSAKTTKTRNPLLRLLAEARTRVTSPHTPPFFIINHHHQPSLTQANPQFNSPMATPAAAAAAAAASVRATRPFQPVYPRELYRNPAPAPFMPFARRQLFFFCRTLKWCLLGVIFLASLLGLMWIIFHPNFPILNVASASMSPLAFTATAASAELSITLVLSNPNNHLAASYDRMEISLLYASQQATLSEFHQPRILQPKRNQATFQANLSFSGVDLGGGVVSSMKHGLDRGSLALAVKIFSAIQFRNGVWKTKSRYMRAYCPGVSFGFTSSNTSGIFLNPYQECQVYIYSG